MKFVLRSGLNAGASLVVSLFTLYMLSVLTSIILIRISMILSLK